MTQAEKKKIERAVRLLYSENGHEEAIILLGDLCGLRTAAHVIRDAKLTRANLSEIARHGNSEFTVKEKEPPK